MSHAISPWSQRRREGRSPAVLEAPRRELIRQRQRSPAAYPASAGRRRSLRGWLVSNPSSRSPQVWQCPAAGCGGTRSLSGRCELSSLRRRRKRLLNHPSIRGCRLRAAGRRPRASISRQRSLFGGTYSRAFLDWQKQNDVFSHRFAPTDEFGVQIDLTQGFLSKSEMPHFPPS
jgi:hypothetical protein